MKKLTIKTSVNLFNMKEGKEYFVDFEDKFCPWTIGITKENGIVTVKYYGYVEKIEENGENLELYSIIEPLELQGLVDNWKKIIDIVSMCKMLKKMFRKWDRKLPPCVTQG